MTGKAVVAISPGQVQVDEVRLPEPGPEDVVVRLAHSWISNGTESSFVRGERIAGDTARRPDDPLPFPHVPGYQKTGIVESVGSKVVHVQPGDAVFVSISQVEGMWFPFAGHVSPSVAHASQVWTLGDGSLVGCSSAVLTQVGWNIGMRAPLADGDAALVIGDGLVGQWAAQTLQARGARVGLIGRHPYRTSFFAPGAGDWSSHEPIPSECIREWAPEGIALVAHTAGTVCDLMGLRPFLKRGGHIVSAGFLGVDGKVDVQELRDLELSLHAVAGWTGPRMLETLDWILAGRLRTEPLITHRFPVDDAADAYRMILTRSEPCLGVVLDWSEA